MLFEIQDGVLYFLLGMAAMFILILIIGFFVRPKKENIDKYHPLNKKE